MAIPRLWAFSFVADFAEGGFRAGDTVAAVCTAAMAAGCDAVTAAEIANFAAGVVVGKIGTAPIMKEELIAALDQGDKIS